jgi:hypothetical protein
VDLRVNAATSPIAMHPDASNNLMSHPQVEKSDAA